MQGVSRDERRYVVSSAFRQSLKPQFIRANVLKASRAYKRQLRQQFHSLGTFTLARTHVDTHTHILTYTQHTYMWTHFHAHAHTHTHARTHTDSAPQVPLPDSLEGGQVLALLTMAAKGEINLLHETTVPGMRMCVHLFVSLCVYVCMYV